MNHENQHFLMSSEALIKVRKKSAVYLRPVLTAPWTLLNVEIVCKITKQMTQNSRKVKLLEEIKIHYSY